MKKNRHRFYFKTFVGKNDSFSIFFLFFFSVRSQLQRWVSASRSKFSSGEKHFDLFVVFIFSFLIHVSPILEKDLKYYFCLLFFFVFCFFVKFCFEFYDLVISRLPLLCLLWWFSCLVMSTISCAITFFESEHTFLSKTVFWSLRG